MNKKKNKLLLMLVLMCGLCLTLIQTSAKEISCSEDGDSIAAAYGFEISAKNITSASATVVLKSNLKGKGYSSSQISEMKKTTFKVIKVANRSVNKTFNGGSTIEFTVNSTDRNEYDEIPVVFETTNNKCVDRTITFTYQVMVGADVETTEEYDPIELTDISKMVRGNICSSKYDSTRTKAEQRFCDLKKKACGSKSDASCNNTSRSASFKCNVNVSKKYSEQIKDFNKVNEYKTESDFKKITNEYYTEDNTKYLYGYKYKEYNVGKYEYPQKYIYGSRETKSATCSLKCEEAVVVQYGPPVATKAGLCFQYSVKVESRVDCYVTNVEKPDTSIKVCTPSPSCDNGRYKQGGPDEEFDSCIQECDGGKYSSKCTTKCYNEVYNSDNKLTSNNTENEQLRLLGSSYDTSDSYLINNVIYKDARNHNGYYYTTTNKGKSISWKPSGNKGRWYYNNSWGISGHSYGKVVEGIPRWTIGGRRVCHDSCGWTKGKCKKGDYLNYGLGQYYNKINKEKYEKAVEECYSKATCSTETTEYTISAKYKQKSTEEDITINFPYTSTKKDILGTCKSDEASTANDVKTTILQYAGCYNGCLCTDNNKEDSNNTCNKYYMTEWSFGNSYINKKTGEIKYGIDTGSDSSYRVKNKYFCVPRDAGSVNVDWYQWYMYNIEGLKNADIDKDYANKCVGKAAKKDSKKYTGSIEKWNIEATTKSFGKLNWNINMKCFYALDDGTIKDDDTKNTTCLNAEKRIRTVQTSNMFPQSNKVGAKDRKIGFNWTAKANLEKRDFDSTENDTIKTNYANNPSIVKEYYEKGGDNSVDYYFKLSPTDLSNIKKYNETVTSGSKKAATKNLSVYCGTFVTGSNISIYQSNLFRGVGGSGTGCPGTSQIITGNIPNIKSTLKCNNIFGENEGCNTQYRLDKK